MNSINKKTNKGALGVVWSERETLTTKIWNKAVAAASGVYVANLRINSVSNPLGTVSPIQPARYDQFAQMYASSLVRSVRYRMKFTNELGGSAVTYPFVVAVYPISLGSLVTPPVPATFQAAASIPGAKTGEWSPGGSSVVIDMACKIDSVLGRPFNSSDYEVSGVVPDTKLYFGVFIQHSITSPVSCVITYDIDQAVDFCERKYVIDT